ncbi:hypothetical protein [Dorea sp. D27]|uniref:hypothetical protein n=1 Tax=Dorea sp. D27 TaxID=658665 RepID=UPI000673A673|nr:hypothetical protein [Dorea sp. D27]KMZ52501.1 hypothetical protein HMPREF0980_03440 [Dorea sp. D27]
MIIKRRQKDKEEDRSKEIQKEREKRRRKMMRGKYGQAPLKHAKKGINSCCYAGTVFLILMAMLVFSYVSGGSVSVIAGFAGLAVAILAWLGLMSGIRGFREREKNYITCKAGVVCNALLLMGLMSIFFRGLF